jgi:hypothetical protein
MEVLVVEQASKAVLLRLLEFVYTDDKESGLDPQTEGDLGSSFRGGRSNNGPGADRGGGSGVGACAAERDTTLVPRLLAAADRYNLYAMKRVCENLIAYHPRITHPHNAALALQLAKRYNSPFLERFCLHCLASRPMHGEPPPGAVESGDVLAPWPLTAADLVRVRSRREFEGRPLMLVPEDVDLAHTHTQLHGGESGSEVVVVREALSSLFNRFRSKVTLVRRQEDSSPPTPTPTPSPCSPSLSSTHVLSSATTTTTTTTTTPAASVPQVPSPPPPPPASSSSSSSSTPCTTQQHHTDAPPDAPPHGLVSSHAEDTELSSFSGSVSRSRSCSGSRCGRRDMFTMVERMERLARGELLDDGDELDQQERLARSESVDQEMGRGRR